VTRAPRLVGAAVLAALATSGTGCDYLRDTAAQKVAGRRFKACAAAVRDVRLDRIEPDGRIHFTYVSIDERDRLLRCLEEAGRDRERLPDPLPASPAGK